MKIIYSSILPNLFFLFNITIEDGVLRSDEDANKGFEFNFYESHAENQHRYEQLGEVKQFNCFLKFSKCRLLKKLRYLHNNVLDHNSLRLRFAGEQV